MAGTTVEPERTRHLAFGDLAAVWSVLERLDVAGVVDEVVGERRSDAAASVGTYIALAVANRVVAPCSKLAFADWWATTTGPDRWVRLPTAALDHRRFWDAMDAISAEQLVEIERRVTARVARYRNGGYSSYTNVLTGPPIAQRGHAKQKRRDLRLIGLGLVVSTDGGVPLLSHAYACDRPDVTQFADMVNELLARWGVLAAEANDLTLVYDAGQDSLSNQAVIEATPLHFVGSLPPSDFPELLAVPASRFRKSCRAPAASKQGAVRPVEARCGARTTQMTSQKRADFQNDHFLRTHLGRHVVNRMGLARAGQALSSSPHRARANRCSHLSGCKEDALSVNKGCWGLASRASR